MRGMVDERSVGAHFGAEDLVAQALGGGAVVRPAAEPDGVGRDVPGGHAGWTAVVDMAAF